MTAVDFGADEPSIETIAAMEGAVLMEFGADWCGHCRAAQPLVAAALKHHQVVKHMKIADGSGRPLGRHYRVKLWPTLIFLKQGQEIARLVRPQRTLDIDAALAAIEALA